MKADMKSHQGDMHYDIDWTTLGEYLDKLQSQGHCAQCRLLRGGGHRAHQCAGRGRCAADARAAAQMRDAGAPGDGAGRAGRHHRADLQPQHLRQRRRNSSRWPSESALCGGMYIAHMRSEGDRIDRGGAGNHRYRERVGRARRDLSLEGRGPSQLAQARPRHRAGRRQRAPRVPGLPPTCMFTRPARPGSM